MPSCDHVFAVVAEASGIEGARVAKAPSSATSTAMKLTRGRIRCVPLLKPEMRLESMADCSSDAQWKWGISFCHLTPCREPRITSVEVPRTAPAASSTRRRHARAHRRPVATHPGQSIPRCLPEAHRPARIEKIETGPSRCGGASQDRCRGRAQYRTESACGSGREGFRISVPGDGVTLDRLPPSLSRCGQQGLQ